MSANHSKTKKKSSIGFVEGVRRSRPLYLLMLPSIIIFALFTYYPMYGIVIAFKNFTPADGIMGSSWAGLKYFKQYFNSYQFGLTIKNTIIISLYTIAVTFPLPVIMGLLVNQMKAQKFKKILPGINLPAALHLHRCYGRNADPVSFPKYRYYRKAGRTAWIQAPEPDGKCKSIPAHLCMV